MDVKTASDEALIQAVQQKNIQAFEELYDRHHGIALAVAYRVLGGSGLAEDAVQEAFLGLWRKPETFRPERGSARAWFLGNVRHRAIDITRGRPFTTETTSLDSEDVLHVPSAEGWDDVDAALERGRVRQALASLPGEQRETIMLAYYGGLTQQEIAQRTGVPLGTVKGRIRLAMQKLRGALVQVGGGGSY